jgi:hypothetical protein
MRQWAIGALERAGKPWRLACVSPSFCTVTAGVAAGLAVSVFKASIFPASLRMLGPRDGLPALPEADIALHRAPDLPREARALAEHLLDGLRDRSSPATEGAAEPAHRCLT